MLFFNYLASGVSEARMIAASLIVIFYLIVIELTSINKDEAEVNKIFNPVILLLVVLFGFIVLFKVKGILK